MIRQLVILIALLPTSALGLDLRGTAWADVADGYRQLDPALLYAIALTEAGREVGDGLIRPWPWALNIDGRPVFATNRQEAAALIEALHTHHSIDVGLLQISTRWHGHRVQHLADLLDPAINLEVGAAILAEALASAPGDLAVGVGRYHSHREDRGRRYAATVLSFYRFLIHTAPNDWKETQHEPLVATAAPIERGVSRPGGGALPSATSPGPAAPASE